MPQQPQQLLSLMRYDAVKKTFEYKLDEKLEAMEIPEANISAILQSIKSSGDKKMVETFEFLVKNAKAKPGQWAEASSENVSKGQATV